jgi:hypothetical protein
MKAFSGDAAAKSGQAIRRFPNMFQEAIPRITAVGRIPAFAQCCLIETFQGLQSARAGLQVAPA